MMLVKHTLLRLQLTAVVLLVSLACVITGCASYIYAPSLLLTEKQLEKGAVDIKAGVGKLPETRRSGANTTLGGVMSIGYGFGRNVNVYLSGWSDVTTETLFLRGGLAAAGRVSLWRKENAQLLTYPRISIYTNNGENFDAMGFELPIVFLTPVSQRIYTYFGMGGAYGNRQLLADNALSNEELYAAIGYMGIGYLPMSQLQIMLELNPIYQFNGYDKRTSVILSPTFAIGYLFNQTTPRSKYENQRFHPK